jgi:hypothetical protein
MALNTISTSSVSASLEIHFDSNEQSECLSLAAPTCLAITCGNWRAFGQPRYLTTLEGELVPLRGLISSRHFNPISRECLYRTEWHVANLIDKLRVR